MLCRSRLAASIRSGEPAERVTGELRKARAIRRTLAEPLADLVGQRVSEVGMIENGR